MAKRKKQKKEILPAKTVAAIDIGTNSIRLAIAQVLPDGSLEILERLQQALRLGQDTFKMGRLSGQTMRAAVSILRKYQELLKTYSVEQVRAVATSAIREAKNADNFLDRILVATGVDVNVISAAEESRLRISALRDKVGKKYFSRGKVLVAEVGGGSTILNMIGRGEIKATQSLAIGAIRTQEVLSTNSESPQQAAQMVEHRAQSAISAITSILPVKRIKTFIAMGGDARWLADQVGSRSNVSGLRSVSRKGLAGLIKQYRDYSADELSRSLKIPYTEAETLTTALMVYQKILYSTAAEKMTVSDIRMIDGLLLDIAHSISGKVDTTKMQQVTNSAEALAEKYHVDMVHAQHVSSLAGHLYDELKRQQWLNIENKPLLQAAAILHEVGMFVSSRAHHKHTYYIISNSELFGIDPKNLELVAHIARYHRRSRPKAPHVEYMRLHRSQRMIINKLAGILRIADALDVNRSQEIKDFNCKFEDDELILTVKGTSDLTLEKRAISLKGDLFEDIYGLKIKLEKE